MKRRDEVLVGLLTLVAIITMITGMLWLARGGLAGGYPLYAKFAWGAGLRQGQPVLFSGVNVGFVDEVDLLDDGGLLVTMRVYKHRLVPAGTVANIAPNGFFGDQLIALRADSGPNGAYHKAGDTLRTRATTQLSDIVAKVDTMSRNLNTLLAGMRTELIDNGSLASVRRAAERADSMFKAIGRLASEQSAEFTRTQESLRRAASAIDSARIGAAIDSIARTAGNMSSLVTDFRDTNRRLAGILTKIDSGSGTAAKLLNDAQLERDVRGLLVRMDSLMADFMANPKKYIRVSIF